jgi:hypothetical protein
MKGRPARGADGRFLPTWVFDPFDPRGWDEALPFRPLQLSERDEALFCIVDLEDWDWASRYLWFATHARESGSKKYAGRTDWGRRKLGGPHRLTWLHKEILLRAGAPPSQRHIIGDHINGNSLDNRRSNLRWATPDENNRNRYGFYAYQLQLGLIGEQPP